MLKEDGTFVDTYKLSLQDIDFATKLLQTYLDVEAFLRGRGVKIEEAERSQDPERLLEIGATLKREPLTLSWSARLIGGVVKVSLLHEELKEFVSVLFFVKECNISSLFTGGIHVLQNNTEDVLLVLRDGKYDNKSVFARACIARAPSLFAKDTPTHYTVIDGFGYVADFVGVFIRFRTDLEFAPNFGFTPRIVNAK